MKEWSRKSEFNSFNSWKGLLYSKWYETIIDWQYGKRDAPLPPVEASFDPIHACNLCCAHCNAASYLISDLKNRRMDDNHMMFLIKFLGKWGVKAICFGGGGEPTLHSELPYALYLTNLCGMQSSIATNGTKFAGNKELLTSSALHCRWVGISVDAATPKTYNIGRRKDCFEDTIKGIKELTREIKLRNSNCEVAFKFLLFDYNQHEIYDACKLAKSLGVKDFHARPADYSHQGMGKEKKKVNPYDLKLIEEQFERCHELEDENFRVFTIIHKFNPDFTPKRDFSQCYATPLIIQICADNNIYLCPDQRHQEYYKLGTHYPDPKDILKFWGGERHYELVFGNTPEKCKTRCTFGRFCKQCEVLFANENDPMCKWFT